MRLTTVPRSGWIDESFPADGADIFWHGELVERKLQMKRESEVEEIVVVMFAATYSCLLKDILKMETKSR